MPTYTDLHPRLIVDDPDAALAFYARCLEATILERFTDDADRVVHAAFSLGDDVVSMAQAVPEWGLASPGTLGGSPCLMHLTVDDPDGVAARMAEGGAEILIPIDDRPYGKREGRVLDPHGHLWILSTPIEDLSDDEIRTRLKGAP